MNKSTYTVTYMRQGRVSKRNVEAVNPDNAIYLTMLSIVGAKVLNVVGPA